MMIHEAPIDDELIRPTRVEVDLGAISQNFRAIKEIVNGRRVMCILKANAYGHGLIRVARHLESLKADYFGVAYLEEGIALRKAGIVSPILVLGGIIGNQIPYFIEYDLTITASSVEKLQQIELAAGQMNKKAKIHLKIDTGMERIGIHYYSAESLLKAASEVTHCEVEGIYSHLAKADDGDTAYSRMQIDRFNDVLRFYDKHHIRRPMVHMDNSAGTLQYPDMHHDMVRVGLMLYGVYPVSDMADKVDLQPALSWKTRVVYFKVIMPDHPVSYGGTWSSSEMTRLVTIPVGYGDGYFRSMSNKAQVLIRGHRYPAVGNICMDQMMVNIGWHSAYNGDEVVLIGHQGDHQITVEDLAGWAGTIPYEILTNINTRVPRIYLNG